MRGYARTVFEPETVELMRRAARIVRALPDSADERSLRCHEVARAVGQLLGLEVQDGAYGSVEHSWLWIKKPPTLKRLAPSTRYMQLLDCYAVGRLPQVQLVDLWAMLPEASAYKCDARERDDIRHTVVKKLVSAGRRALRRRKAR